MYALDVDTIEMEKTRKRLADKGFGPDILTIKHLNFANIDQVAEEAGGFVGCTLGVYASSNGEMSDRFADVAWISYEGIPD